MIAKLKIRNFRSFRDVEIPLGTLNALVGPNMSGKSNLIDLFKFLSDLLVPNTTSPGIPNAFNRRGGFRQVMWKGAESELIEIELEGRPREPHRDLTEWHYSLKLLGDLHYNFARVSQEELHVRNEKTERVLISTKENRRVIYKSDGSPYFEIMDSNRLALGFDSPDPLLTQIRNSLTTSRFYNLIPPMMRVANQLSAPEFLNEFGDNFSSWLMLLQTRFQQSFSRLRTVVLEAFPDLQDLFTWPTQQSTVFLASNERFLKSAIGIQEMSDGELSFIALLSLILAPLELGSELSCVEEPESHLHPRLIVLLMGIYRQVREELGSNAGQVIIATHSPFLIDQLNIEEVILVNKKSGETKLTRAADRKSLKDLVESEEAGLGKLYFSGALADA